MRHCRQRVWHSKHKVQTLLVPHLEPATPVILTLRDKGPILYETLLIPALDESRVDFVPLDVSDVPDIDASDPMWEGKHPHSLLHTYVVEFEGAYRFRCGFHWTKYELC